MNLHCPNCAHLLPYDHRLGGTTITCPSCKTSVTVPPFTSLPIETQVEYRQEMETARKKKEKKEQDALRKEEHRKETDERKRGEAEQAHQRQIEKEQMQAQRNREHALEMDRWEAQQAEWDGQKKLATRTVPEEDAIEARYPTLQSLASLIKVIGVVLIVIMWLGWMLPLLLALGSTHGGQGVVLMMTLLSAIPLFVVSAIVWIVFFSYAEMLLLAIDVANDVRINRFLLKGMRYAKKSDDPSP